MAASGDAQEARAKEFVRRLGCGEVVVGEVAIKTFLQMRVIVGADSNCADIVGFRPNFKSAVGAVVCESKGTDVDHALVQLGNVAAAILERFASESRFLNDLVLIVYRSGVRKIDIGDSPGPGYITGKPDPTSGMRTLIDAGTADRKAAAATASLDLKRLDVCLTKWGERVAKLPVYVYVES
jgi:hypothetical protein